MDAQAEPRDSANRAEPLPALKAGLMGRGIQASRTPGMHKAEGGRLGFSYEYALFDFDCLGLADSELPNLIAKVRADGYSGLNITHPFKERVVESVDSLSPDAASIGAVNTIVFGKNGAVGHNTDCWGFAESFRRGLPQSRLERVALIGAGGAGMAVAKALLDLGVRRLTIFDTDHAKSGRLVEKLLSQSGTERAETTSDLGAALAHADGLVNATPAGMAKYPGMPVEGHWLRRDLWVSDIVYFPAETELLRTAKAAGCQTLPGAGMAIFQAVMAFELITGIAPDPDQMSRHFRAD